MQKSIERKNIGMAKNRVKETPQDKAVLITCYVLVSVVAVLTLLPFWELFVTSFSSRAEAVKTGLKLFTFNPELTAYKQVLSSPGIWRSILNSVVRVVLGTTLSVGITALTAYPLAKKDFIFNKTFTVLILFTMVFSGGLIPTYLTITTQLHLTDTIWSMILPSAVGAYNLIIARNFLREIPAEVEESARIDGAGEFRIWWCIVLPLSKAVLATIALWKAVEHWNAYFDCLLYVRDQTKFVLQIFLRRVLVEQQMSMLQDGTMMELAARPTEATTRAALIMISTIPIVMIYPFLQKYFMKGIMLGSVKG